LGLHRQPAVFFPVEYGAEFRDFQVEEPRVVVPKNCGCLIGLLSHRIVFPVLGMSFFGVVEAYLMYCGSPGIVFRCDDIFTGFSLLRTCRSILGRPSPVARLGTYSKSRDSHPFRIFPILPWTLATAISPEPLRPDTVYRVLVSSHLPDPGRFEVVPYSADSLPAKTRPHRNSNRPPVFHLLRC